jgi:hypothetical protein
MRALGVVITAPRFQHDAGLRQRAEQDFVQELVAQPPIETLDERVLHRLAGGDVMPGDFVPIRPGQDCVRGQLGKTVLT